MGDAKDGRRGGFRSGMDEAGGDEVFLRFRGGSSILKNTTVDVWIVFGANVDCSIDATRRVQLDPVGVRGSFCRGRFCGE